MGTHLFGLLHCLPWHLSLLMDVYHSTHVKMAVVRASISNPEQRDHFVCLLGLFRAPDTTP